MAKKQDINISIAELIRLYTTLIQTEKNKDCKQDLELVLEWLESHYKTSKYININKLYEINYIYDSILESYENYINR